ncbi:endodeoxyribonuclease [Sporothrix stenoceras]|uniref:DNA topoisomerase (ATP-hydrolyzing) n=1 Tax=Sporothrix stenoceras TaxID=5173 RepID=A0ABR3YZW4_9PEZI
MGSTVNKIEQIIENVLDNVNRGQKLSIPFSRRAKPRAGRVIQKSQSRGFVSFPGKTEAESKLFTQVLSILQLSHQALLSGTFVTKRNIFYQYRELFRDQRVVDGLVDDIAYTLSLGRDSLNIELDLSACQWILVIEKEATFRTLAASGYWNTSMAGPGALVTSKGYPTLVTRWFLHHIHESAPRLPIYGLVDYDPHGVRIFRTYKYGSQSLSHETNTTVPGMKWLGIQSCDLMYPANSVSPRHWSALDDVLPLTDADRRTAACLLKDMVYNANVGTEESSYEQIREVQVMLMLNVKAEIQAADDYGDLAEWLDEKLYRAQEGDMEEMY